MSRGESAVVVMCFLKEVVGIVIEDSLSESTTALLQKATIVSVGCCVVVFSSYGLITCNFFDSRFGFSAIDELSAEDFDSLVPFFVHAVGFFCFFAGVICAKISLVFVTLLLAAFFATGDDVVTVGLA